MDINAEAAAMAERERLLNQSWIWHVPHKRWEIAVIGAVVSWLLPALWVTVAFGGWPWWQSLIVAAAIAPWVLVAAAMAIRAPWCRGVNKLAALIAAAPAVAWIATVTTAHTFNTANWVHRLAVPMAYIGLSAATVSLYRRWTEATADSRRRARWEAEGDNGPQIDL